MVHRDTEGATHELHRDAAHFEPRRLDTGLVQEMGETPRRAAQLEGGGTWRQVLERSLEVVDRALGEIRPRSFGQT